MYSKLKLFQDLMLAWTRNHNAVFPRANLALSNDLNSHQRDQTYIDASYMDVGHRFWIESGLCMGRQQLKDWGCYTHFYKDSLYLRNETLLQLRILVIEQNLNILAPLFLFKFQDICFLDLYLVVLDSWKWLGYKPWKMQSLVD